MKKMIALILCLVLSTSLLLCGCNSTASNAEKPSSNTNVGQTLADTQNNPFLEDVEPPVVTNEFFNDSNSFYDADSLSIRPRHLYWDGNTLVAECFVTNGKSTPAFNITVDKLAFSNDQVGTFAVGGFGYIDGLTVPAYGYTVWTFTFSGDAVSQVGADLSSLTYESSTSFSH